MKTVVTMFLALGMFGSVLAQETKPIRALLITGGCCHDYNKQKTILTEGISKRANVEWTVVHEGGSSTNHKVSIHENADWAKGYDVVVHNECFADVKDEEFISRIAKAHAEGTAAVMLHCAMHSYRDAKSDEWRKCLGLTTRNHEKRRDLLIKNLKSDHPVMKGFPAEWKDADDELYMNLALGDTATPLAGSYGQDTKKDHVVAWLNTYEKGKIFATTLGHQNSTMEQETYLDLVTRGLLWSVGKLDDKGEALPGYGPKK